MKRRLTNSSLVVASLLIALIVIELALRVAARDFRWVDFRGEQQTLFRSAYPAVHDATMGWLPREGEHGSNNVWGTDVTILENGIRSNGQDRPSGKTILVVGDSFTFGDQVNDHDTWPAALERLLERPVLNGGVFGYGLDQSFLRADSLASFYRPDILVIAFIPNDITRCEMSVRMGAAKPYFDVDTGGHLSLMNTPVPRPPERSSGTNYMAARSYAVHRLMMRIQPQRWLVGKDWQAVRVHSNGLNVCVAILRGLSQLAKRNGIREIYVLVQYPTRNNPIDVARVDRLIASVQDTALTVVDLRESLDAVRRGSPERFAGFFDSHMTRVGNEFTAEVLAEAMR